jgi:hypothetical protein
MAPESAKRSVKIDLSRNRTIELVENLCELGEEIWYPPDFYPDMKAQGKRDAKEWRRRGYGSLLLDTFGGGGAAAAATGVDEDDAGGAQQRLAAYCLLDGLEDDDGGGSGGGEAKSRRGLERSLSKSHGDERSRQKDKVRQSLLAHQDRLMRRRVDKGEMGREGAAVGPEEQAEALAALYGESCRSAHRFARRMGIADALAVEHHAAEPTRRGGSEEEEADAELRIRHAFKVLERAREWASSGGALGAGRAKVARRNSNASLASSTCSVNSFDSNRRFGCGGERSREPPRRTDSRSLSSPPQRHRRTSPVSLSEELYAAVA